MTNADDPSQTIQSEGPTQLDGPTAEIHVGVRQRPVTLDGQPLAGEPEGRPTYVMAREDGRWLIVSGQNTRVVDP